MTQQPNNPFNRPQRPQQGPGGALPSRPQPPQQEQVNPVPNPFGQPQQAPQQASGAGGGLPRRPQAPRQEQPNPFGQQPPSFSPQQEPSPAFTQPEEPVGAPGLTSEQLAYLTALQQTQQQVAQHPEQQFVPDYNQKSNVQTQDFSIPGNPTAIQAETPVTPKGKGRKGKAKPVKGKKKKTEEELTPREQKYAGARKKVFWTRFGFISFVSTMVVVGIGALIFMPTMKPTAAELSSAAASAVNYTGFPVESGERFVLDFADAFWNFKFSDYAEVREEQLSQYVTNAELLKQIIPTGISQEEFDKLRTEKGLVRPDGTPLEYNEYVKEMTQDVEYGPYVVAIDNISPTYAIYTVKIKLVGQSKPLYWDVPVLYDPENLSLTVAGPPSFSKVIMNTGDSATELDYISSFATGGDEELAESFSSDLEAYLAAWAQSDETLIKRYTSETAQINALTGLDGQVQFKRLDSFVIEPENLDEVPKTATQRKAEIFVTWEIPNAETGVNVSYTQQFRLLLVKNADDKWSIFDIQNFAVFK